MAPLYSCQECCVTNCSVAFIFRSDSVLYHYLLIFFSSLFCLHRLLFCLTGIWSCPKCLERTLIFGPVWNHSAWTKCVHGCLWQAKFQEPFEWTECLTYISDRTRYLLTLMLCWGFSGYWNVNPFFFVVVIKTNRKKHVGN